MSLVSTIEFPLIVFTVPTDFVRAFWEKAAHPSKRNSRHFTAAERRTRSRFLPEVVTNLMIIQSRRSIKPGKELSNIGKRNPQRC
jgi:hypothetical protein